MREIRLRLAERIKRTETIESFRFIPQEKIEFMPGQFLQLIFDEAGRANPGLNKYLSFSSSPAKDYVEVTKRLSESSFSQRLKNLKIDDNVLCKAPLGSCVFRESYEKIGFLIGGIGITPVIAIIEYIIDKKLPTDVSLLYSNRDEPEIAFKKELDYWQAINKKIKVFYTVTDCEPKDKNCLFGRIDKEMFLAKVEDTGERAFFIFGPPRMVEAMAALCLQVGCKEENIRKESFIGY
ncbi:MAG: FAD-dependent oxidoreductase [Candidatus Omnitrophota bacterium]|jgi:ferredoxin-NADP reductase